MNPQAILEKIQEDARLSAEQIVSDAKSKIESIQSVSRLKLTQLHDTTLKQAAQESEQMKQRMLRMSQLEDRKELLAKKRELIDQAFAMATDQLRSMPKEQARAFFIAQTVGAASGDEKVVVCKGGSPFYEGDLIAELNAALVKAGKTGNLTLSDETKSDAMGIILQSHGAEINCTFEAMIESKRSQLETEVASALFGE